MYISLKESCSKGFNRWSDAHQPEIKKDVLADGGADGVAVGPLKGLPVSIKGLLRRVELPTAGRSLEGDGPLVATLRCQLGVITGETHMVELAFVGTGHNSHRLKEWRHPSEAAATGARGK